MGNMARSFEKPALDMYPYTFIKAGRSRIIGPNVIYPPPTVTSHMYLLNGKYLGLGWQVRPSTDDICWFPTVAHAEEAPSSGWFPPAKRQRNCPPLPALNAHFASEPLIRRRCCIPSPSQLRGPKARPRHFSPPHNPPSRPQSLGR